MPFGASQVVLVVKNLAASAGDIKRQGTSISGPEKSPSILAWGIPWTEEHGRLQSIGLQRVGHDWSNLACMHAPCHLRLMLASWNCNLKNPCFSFSAMNWMITTERVSYGAAVSEPTYDMLEMHDLRRALDLLIENQRFNKISRCFLYILKSEKTWSRESHLRSSLIAAFLSNCYLGRISAFHEQRANQLSRLGLVPAITITSYSDPLFGIVGKWLSTLARSTSCLEQCQWAPQVTISEPKGKCGGKHSWNIFFLLLKISWVMYRLMKIWETGKYFKFIF